MGKGSTIGSGIGAVAGSFIPGVGTLLGSGIGGMIGGLFGNDSADAQQEQANQWRKDGVQSAQDRYGSLSPYRAMGLQQLSNPQHYDLSNVYGNGPRYTPVGSALQSQGEAAQSKTLNDLSNGPDYMSQARQAMSDYDTGAAPVLAAQRRLVGQSAANLGRIGSGGVTTSLGNVESDYERNRGLAGNEFMRNALDQNQINKYRTLDAAQAVTNSAYGRGSAERGNQQEVAQQGVQNRANQFGMERNAMGQDYAHGMGLASLGYSSDPTQAYFQGANGTQNAADSSSKEMRDLGTGLANQIGKFRKIGGGVSGGTDQFPQGGV